ncbi:MAG TPA: YggT family protein, partial [Burkholderiales bacterium]|nr:YggT family protein [Burkholderiales bacterium]
MLNQGLFFILNTVFGLFIVALLLRFYLQLMRAPYRNPLSHFLISLTDFLVRPARRLIPGLWGLDLATLLLAWIIEFFVLAAIFWLNGIAPHPYTPLTLFVLLLLSAVGLLKHSIHIFMLILIIQAVLSWVNPYSQISEVLNSLSRPFLIFFRRRIPLIGNVDISPLIALILFQFILAVPVAWIDSL